MQRAPQPGGNSSHREDRKDLKELQLFFFAVLVVLAVRCLPMMFSQLPTTRFSPNLPSIGSIAT